MRAIGRCQSQFQEELGDIRMISVKESGEPEDVVFLIEVIQANSYPVFQADSGYEFVRMRLTARRFLRFSVEYSPRICEVVFLWKAAVLSKASYGW